MLAKLLTEARRQRFTLGEAGRERAGVGVFPNHADVTIAIEHDHVARVVALLSLLVLFVVLLGTVSTSLAGGSRARGHRQRGRDEDDADDLKVLAHPIPHLC